MTCVAYLRALCFLLVVITLSPARAASGVAEPMVPQYVHERWSLDRGFPGGKVQAIAQTPDGFLWVGTEQGLTQFDGQSFRTAPAAQFAPTQLAPVLGLLTDARGDVWIRVGGDKLFRYSEGRLDDVLWLLHNEDAVTAMCRTSDGSVLLAGLLNGIVKYREGHFETLVPTNRLPRSPITSIVEAADGSPWFGTQDRGTFHVKDGGVFPFRDGLPSLKIISMLRVGDDIWIGTERGMVRWSGTRIATEGVPPALRRERVLAMLLDRRSNLWVGTPNGLFRVERNGKSFNLVGRFENISVTALFEDRDGNLWVGDAGAGIERVQESRFTTFAPPNGAPSQEIGPVYVDSENHVWFAPSYGGLYELVDGMVRPVPIIGASERDVVYSIAGAGTDLWIGKMRSGLTLLQVLNNAKARVIPNESFTEKNGLAQNSVFTVHVARDGAVWAGTLNGGVSQWKSGYFKTFSVANGLPSNSVSDIAETADGTIWVATLRGLTAWSGNHWRSYGIHDGLPSETINCLLEDSQGTLWVGTAEGLAVVKEGAVHVVPNAPRALRGSVVGVAEDRRGSLWVVTATSLIQVPRQKLLDGSIATTDVREFGVADGLPTLGGVRRDRSIVTDLNGRVWIATGHGLSVVDPAELERNSTPTLTRIEAVVADGNSITPVEQLHIPAGRQRITIAYGGLNLSAPERVRFRYKLEGFDRDWSEPTIQRERDYTNLGPGTYRFRVIASDPEGRWTSSESSIDFVVDPRFYQTLWFRFTLGLAVLGVAIAIYRVRLHQIARRLHVGFEERLAERTRIAQDLHDTLLQGLLSASMQLHIADEKLAEDSPAKPLVARVLKLMNTVSAEGRNVVSGLRSSNRSGDDLELAFSRIRQELSISEQVSFRIVVEGRRRLLRPAIRDEAYRIGREALVNAFRHSAADLVEVTLAYEFARFRLVFSDNGKGIDPELLRAGRDGHWGLSGMRERAERIGANLKVSSRATSGTDVELLIPEHIAFLSPNTSRFGWLQSLRRRRIISGLGLEAGNENRDKHNSKARRA